MRKIRIVLADDHKLMRSGLRVLLEQQQDFTVVGEASDGREAVALIGSQNPDVLVMDIGMPNLNGIEAALQITQANPQISIVMLSMHSDESYVLRALKAGAKGYLLKDSAESDLIKAVHAVADEGAIHVVIAHGSMIRAADAAKERLVTGSCCRVNVGELLRGVANKLDKLGRDGSRVTGMRVLDLPCCRTVG